MLDDFGPEHAWLSHHIKVWADHYRYTAEVKGGTVQIRPPRLFITSNYHPSEIWKEDPILLKAIERRFQIRKWAEAPPIVFGKKRSPVKQPCPWIPTLAPGS